MDSSVSHPATQMPSPHTPKPKHRWISWAVTIGIFVAAIIHAIVIGVKTKGEKKRRQRLLRVFVAYFIGGLCGWLAIVYLFMPRTFAPSMLGESSQARRLAGFSCLAFSIGGIISSVLRNVPEQRVAVVTYTVFMLGVSGVELYALKGRKRTAVKVYSVPVVKLVTTLILIVFASITEKSDDE